MRILSDVNTPTEEHTSSFYDYNFLFSHGNFINYLPPMAQSAADLDNVHISPKNSERVLEWFATVVETFR